MHTVMKSSLYPYRERPEEFIRREYSQEEKKKLLAYMRSFDYCGVAGLVYDCVTGERLCKGDKKPYEDVCYDDGEFCWSETGIYHIEHYNAAVTDEFFQKVMSQTIG